MLSNTVHKVVLANLKIRINILTKSNFMIDEISKTTEKLSFYDHMQRTYLFFSNIKQTKKSLLYCS